MPGEFVQLALSPHAPVRAIRSLSACASARKATSTVPPSVTPRARLTSSPSVHQLGKSTGLRDFLLGAPPESVFDELEDHIDVTKACSIGYGTFGDVISACTKRGRQQVAVKMLPYRAGCDAQRITNEVQSMQDLIGHPNLIQLIDVVMCTLPIAASSKTPPMLCIVMDLVVDSRPLSHYINFVSDVHSGCTSLREQRHWVYAFAGYVVGSVASALAFMHSRGYVHRDVWSENILVSNARKVVLCDLGCAERHDITENKIAALNIPYMSPAASRGLKQAPSDDCWALALVLSEVVTGSLMIQRLSGVTTKPIHSDTTALEQLTQQTSHRCPILGRICERMIKEYLTVDMALISDQLLADHPECPALPDFKKDLPLLSDDASTHAPSTSSDQMSERIWSNGSEISGSVRIVPMSGSLFLGSCRVSPAPGCINQSRFATVPERVVVAPVTNAAGRNVIAPSNSEKPARAFSPGQRIKYLARSNNVWYPGAILNRLPDNSGWRVSLDCATTKDVSDKDSFRLTNE